MEGGKLPTIRCCDHEPLLAPQGNVDGGQRHQRRYRVEDRSRGQLLGGLSRFEAGYVGTTLPGKRRAHRSCRTEDDLEQLFGDYAERPRSLDACLDALGSADRKVIAGACLPCWYALIALNRRVAAVASARRLRRQDPDVEAFGRIVIDCATLFSFCLAARKLAASTPAPGPSVLAAQRRVLSHDVATALSLFPFHVSHTWGILLSRVHHLQHAPKHSRITELSPSAAADASCLALSLRRLRVEISLGIVEVLVLLKEAVEERRSSPPWELVAHQTCLGPVLLLLPRWTNQAILLPCAEVGGTPTLLSSGVSSSRSAGPSTYPWTRKKQIVTE